MPEDSSPPGGTTGNTYTDLGATTEEAYRISWTSRSLARSRIRETGPEDRIRQRCSVAVGDFAMAGLLAFRHRPVEAGLAALEGRATLIADIRMVQTGIQKNGHQSPVLCALDYGSEIAEKRGITRTSAGVQVLRERLEGSIVVIGNAPSALIALVRLIEEGVRPGLVIGTPVGFVNAAESKEELRKQAVPSVSTVGTRGGTPVAVAAINEIIALYTEQRSRPRC